MSHRDTVLSPDAVQMMALCGWNLAELTASTWPRSVCRHRWLFRSKTRAVWSMPAVTRKSPPQCTSHPHTADEWSLNVCTQRSLTKSHTLAVPSPDVLINRLPRGWKTTPLSQSLCPSPLMTSSPPGIDQVFHVRSSLAVATSGILGWKATAAMAAMWPLKVRCSLSLAASTAGPVVAVLVTVTCIPPTPLRCLSSAGQGVSCSCGRRLRLSSVETPSVCDGPPLSRACGAVEVLGCCSDVSAAPVAVVAPAPTSPASDFLVVCRCSVSTLPNRRSRSRRSSIFSFITDSYLVFSS
mmetsp:Transcript_40106/g.100384  ORF Transcript_40106/g.100384 Transcript_40106/m.100384 type:complete len:296 (-) Transcript_40106:612-1499(-)